VVEAQLSHTSRSAADERYTQELLACGNERRIQENLRMEGPLFLKLCSILKVDKRPGISAAGAQGF
jgi:hypothetical protein